MRRHALPSTSSTLNMVVVLFTEHWETATRLHGITFAEIFYTPTARNSNLSFLNSLRVHVLINTLLRETVHNIDKRFVSHAFYLMHYPEMFELLYG